MSVKLHSQYDFQELIWRGQPTSNTAKHFFPSITYRKNIILWRKHRSTIIGTQTRWQIILVIHKGYQWGIKYVGDSRFWWTGGIDCSSSIINHYYNMIWLAYECYINNNVLSWEICSVRRHNLLTNISSTAEHETREKISYSPNI